MYKFRVIGPDGQVEEVEGNWPNQRDARKYAILSSIMVMSGEVNPDDVEIELIEPAALRWGGARPGAGRPSVAEETIETTVTLSADQAAKAERIGYGNRSKGIRRAIDAYNTTTILGDFGAISRGEVVEFLGFLAGDYALVRRLDGTEHEVPAAIISSDFFSFQREQ